MIAIFRIKGVIGAVCLRTFENYPVILDIWGKMSPKIIQTVKNIESTVPQGMPKSVQAGIPQRFLKTGRKQNALRDDKFKQFAPKCDFKSESLLCFWLFDVLFF